MKSERGITLVSLAAYCIVMLFVAQMILVIRNGIANGVEDINHAGSAIIEINKLSMYMLDETKNSENALRKVSTDAMEFTNGNQYIFVDDAIYKVSSNGSKFKICSDVTSCVFGYEMKNSKELVTVNLTLGKGSDTVTKKMEYVFV